MKSFFTGEPVPKLASDCLRNYCPLGKVPASGSLWSSSVSVSPCDEETGRHGRSDNGGDGRLFAESESAETLAKLVSQLCVLKREFCSRYEWL